MSDKVIGIDGSVIDDGSSLAIRSDDAKRALKAILEKVERGELKLSNWFLLYEEDNGDGTTTSRRADSGLTIAEAVFMLEDRKLQLLQAARL